MSRNSHIPGVLSAKSPGIYYLRQSALIPGDLAKTSRENNLVEANKKRNTIIFTGGGHVR